MNLTCYLIKQFDIEMYKDEQMFPEVYTDVVDTLKARRSVRHFNDRPVPDCVMDRLLEGALEAPSSWNFQARSIVVVNDKAALEGLTAATGGQPHPQEAPAVLVFVAEAEEWKNDQSEVYNRARANDAWNEAFIESTRTNGLAFQEDLQRRGLAREYAVKDAMIAASFAMITAHGLGLATGPMNGWNETAVKKVIGIEDRGDLGIALLLAVGYSDEKRNHPGRRPMPQKVFRNTYAALAVV